jgi:hypothetical protein
MLSKSSQTEKPTCPQTTSLSSAIWTAKAGREKEILGTIGEFQQSIRVKDQGCICWLWHQQPDNSSEFVSYERWENQKALDARMKLVQTEYGPPASGQGTRIPASLIEPYEKWQFTRLLAIE